MKLVKYIDDYADEFNVYGFAIMTAEEWSNFKDNIETAEYPITHYFGSNESVEYYDSSSTLRTFTVSDISPSLIDLLQAEFGKCWGHFPEFDFE